MSFLSCLQHLVLPKVLNQSKAGLHPSPSPNYSLNSNPNSLTKHDPNSMYNKPTNHCCNSIPSLINPENKIIYTSNASVSSRICLSSHNNTNSSIYSRK